MNNDNWSWGTIRNVNYSLNTILERYHKKEISGADRNIRHYIGELYFFRAYAYFSMLRSWGDLPIIEEAFPDDEAILVAANKRMPRNEVARFILSDLGNALLYMSDIDSRRNRLSPDVALLIKSRVALFEGSWLHHFKGTAWVPNGEKWPGKAKDYHADYKYPSGSIEKESDYFFTIAAESAQKIAEKYKSKLTLNSGNVPQNETDAENPYMKMFSSTDPSVFPDVLLWREYIEGLSLCNDIESSVQRANNGVGLTRGLVESFLMKDGKPIYASHDGFKYDDTTIQNIRANADPRLHVFLKAPGQINVFKNMDAQTDQAVPVEPAPRILDTDARKYTTGYTIRKGESFDKAQCGGGHCTTATIGFRATEALLNYIEAQYMLTRDINSGHILEYWKAVRAAAGFTGESQNPATTIAATDVSKETLGWGAYSAGELLTDATLYNIRRERRCELLAESMRWMDLIRWRALDQLIQKPYFIEGFHLWNSPMQEWYKATELIADGSSSATVSHVSQSEYLRPYQRNMTSNNLYRDGFTWTMAHYLQPMPLKQFLLCNKSHKAKLGEPFYSFFSFLKIFQQICYICRRNIKKRNIMTPQEFFKNDLFAENAGVVLLEISEGYSKAKLEIKPEHLNAGARTQGGAIFTLADLALAAAANSHGTLAFSLSSSITFLRASGPGDTLYAEARERYVGRSTGCYQVDITNQNGDLIATFESSVFRKDQKVPFTL